MDPVGRRGFLGKLLRIVGVGVVAPEVQLEPPPTPLRWLPLARPYPPLLYSYENIMTFQPRYNCVLRDLQDPAELVDGDGDLAEIHSPS